MVFGLDKLREHTIATAQQAIINFDEARKYIAWTLLKSLDHAHTHTQTQLNTHTQTNTHTHTSVVPRLLEPVLASYPGS